MYTTYLRYNGNLFLKLLQLKWIYSKILTRSRMLRKKRLVVDLFTFMFIEVLNLIFFHYFWLTVTTWAMVWCQLRCHYNEFYRLSSVGITRINYEYIT